MLQENAVLRILTDNGFFITAIRITNMDSSIRFATENKDFQFAFIRRWKFSQGINNVIVATVILHFPVVWLLHRDIASR